MRKNNLTKELAGKAAAIGEESHEERTCALLEVPG